MGIDIQRNLSPTGSADSVPQISFEFFPPASDTAGAAMNAAAARLAELAPRFFSVTYGAGGSARDRTSQALAQLRATTGIAVAAHLTCAGAPRAAVLAQAQAWWDAGIRHIVALRGDPQPGEQYQPHPDGFAYAADLVAGLRRVADFDISVAAYPEVHPEAPSAAFDLDNLKAKFDAGATRAITQFCFDNARFLRFRDQCAAAGIEGELVAGILPIVNFSQLRRFAARCGAALPAWLASHFDGLEDDPATHELIAAAIVVEQVRELQQHGVSLFHFYTLNRAELSYAACHALGLRPLQTALAS